MLRYVAVMYVNGHNLVRYPRPNPISASLVWEYSRAGIINNFRNSPSDTLSTWINGAECIFTISFQTLKCESEISRSWPDSNKLSHISKTSGGVYVDIPTLFLPTFVAMEEIFPKFSEAYT